jgi:ABC-type branched-subunit amino acid transport system substrate-binding protein/TolA-binding protein
MVTGCASTPPPAPPVPSQPRLPPAVTSAPSSALQTDFAAAQAARARGANSQALQAFSDFVQRYPTSTLADDALLAIGQIAASLGDYRRAQEAYRSLLNNFPTSEHFPIASLELGILQYNAQDYEQSQETLRQYLTTSFTPERQAVAYYYLGLLARKRQAYVEALTALKHSVDTSADALLTQQARAEIEQIVRQHLSGEELAQLTHQYDTTFPGDLLLWQLALSHREAGSVEDERDALQRFVTNFPDHPRLQEATERLRSLQGVAPATDAAKIGVLLPLSGDGSYFGQRALYGIELALDMLHKHHATPQISLVVRDSQGDSRVASEALRTLAQDAQVIGVIGPLFSQVAMDLAAVAEQLEVPYISPYAPEGNFPATSPYAFRNSLTDTLQGRFLAEYAVRGLQLQRFAVLYADDAYGTSLRDAFVTPLREFGGEVVAIAAYAPDATEFSKPIKAIGGVDDETLQDLRAGATVTATENIPSEVHPPIYDAIFIPGDYDKVALLAPALAFYNIHGVQLLGTDGWNAEEILAIGDHSLEGAIFVDGFFADSPAAAVQEFVKGFRQRYNKAPDLLAAQAYDTLLIVAQALQDGATTRSALRDALHNVHNFPGVSGTTSFNADGDATKIPFLLSIQNGRIVQLN